MKPYYTGEKLIELEAVLESWIGTPHRHGCGVKRAGCDCGNFICRVLEETGFATHLRMPHYEADWFRHTKEERLLNWMRDTLPHEDLEKPEDGALMLFSFGRLVSHAAFFMKNNLYHSIGRAGVTKSWFPGCPWSRRNRIAAIFRLVKEDAS